MNSIKQQKDIQSRDVVLWIFALASILLFVFMLFYAKTQCHTVVVYMEEHSVSYMTGRVPMNVTVPAGDYEVLECK